MIKHLHFAFVLLLVAALPGCGMKTYRSDLEKNLMVRTTLSGSFLNSVSAFLRVYDPKDDCRKGYLGGVKLRNGETQLGIPVGRPMHVDIVFIAEAQLHQNAVFTFRPGVRYIAMVSYVDRVYSVSIHEADKRGQPGREIQYQTRNCSRF